ncbi:DUF4347 domain-containing protein [Burkholderia anthina]|uniref:DUF4347 domain-containing protein n=1 Tax=Burkholderia anthina TaxID=179879 RepID=UPI001AA07DED|nr:DUF4347 domain-containing protein [Burkholderia anthina]QTD95634.1 DUF4347 domain-containing protein [Burkholderia anthina]
MKIVKQWFARQSQKQRNAERPGSRVAASPLLLALEPRVVYDASVAAVAAQPHAHEHAHAETHRTEAQTDTATAGNATPPQVSSAPVDKPVRSASRATAEGTDTSAQAQSRSAVQGNTDTQHATANDVGIAMPAVGQTDVVFIDPSVANYQTLIAGLPAGTQYVVLDAGSDGFAQIASYLRSHQGVESISLISHGTDGAIQAGSTWLTASDFSAYSTQLAQIGAAMKPGGDFLIYGCDVAQQADGQALVQQIAGLTHLNVAASIDATGAAALGGNWTLEYQVGQVHTALNESATAQAQFDELLGVTVETYDTAANNNFQALGSSQFTLDGIVYTLDQAANTFAYNDSNSPNGPTDITDSPTDGVLEINADGVSAMSNVTISLANGHTFNLQQFDLSSFNGDLYIQAHYANGTSSALIQLASAAVGGFTGTVSSQLGSAFNNIVSFSLIDQNDSGAFEPSLDNLTYQDTGPTVTTSSGNAAWSSADNGTGTGGTAVSVDPGLTLSDGGSSTAKTATVKINNFQAGDVLNFVAQNGISSVYNTSTGTLTLSTGAGTATIAQWQAALESVSFSSSLTSPNLSTTTRTVSFSFNDGTFVSNIATRNVTITAVDQSPVLSEGGAASTSYLAGTAAAAVDANIHVSDADNASLAAATVTIASGFANGDSLSFINSNSTLYGDIQASYNTSTHALSLFSGSGTATVAQWQAALDAVTFASSSGTTSGTRDITFTVSDGTKTSGALHHSVVVTAGPTVTTDSDSAMFVTGDNTASTPVAVDAGIVVSDGVSTTLASATVQITGNFQVNHDQLLFVNNPATMGDISAIYNTGTGLLTLTSASGTASLAQWQAALRAVTFTSDLVVPSNATRTVSFRINDGTLVSPVATRSVSVTAVDQTPIIGGGGTTVNFTAGDNTISTPVVVDNAITVADADGGPLHTATVTISSNLQPTDVLAFNNNNPALYGDIQATYSNGVLTLSSSSATATLAQWQAALRAVTYTSTAITPSNLSRTVTFGISDGTKSSGTVSATVNVVDTDQTPLINGSSGNVTLTQGDNTSSTPVTVDGGIVVSDLDNGTLASATVAISNFQDGGDVLLFFSNPSTMGNIDGSYSNGVLTLSSLNSTATVAQWQAALRSIQFQNFSSVPTTTPRVINFVISDGTKTSGSWSRTVDVALTDQTPLLDTSGGSTTFTSADNAPSTPVAIDTGLILTDSDSATMASATVQITGNYVAGEDVLALGGSFGDITASFDASNGKLTLSSAGASTTAQWIAALRSVTYTDLAAVPTGTTRTISFAVSDGTKASATETKSLGIVATHQTPVLTSGTSTSQDYLPGNSATTIDSSLALTDLNVGNPSALVSLTITVQITSGFESGDVLSFSGLGQIPVNGISPSYDPSTGTLTITSTGGTLAQWQSVLDNLQFQTDSNAPLGTRAISISISDGVKTSTPATYSIDVISSAPSLATSSTGSAHFQAGDNAPATPITIDGAMTVGDPLGNVVDTAVIAITGNLHTGEDVLGFTNNGSTMGDISGIYNSLTGVLVLTSSSGTATLAQWQSALRSITYTDTAVTPNTATRTVDITLSAGAQTSNTLERTIAVASVDQTPILTTGSTGSAAFIAGDNVASTPVAIDTGIVVSDLDNGTLASATVQIGTGFHAGEDVLLFINDGATMGNITASYDAEHGTLTLSSANGIATLAQWQAALRAVSYTDTAITPDTATRTISFSVNDGTKTSTPITRNVSVADVDQTPVIGSGSSGPAAFQAGDNTVSTPIAVDNGITLSDLDNGTLASAKVQIGIGFHPGEDVLLFVNDGATMGNITASYDAASGTLTLSSSGNSATLAQWQAALRAVTYTDTAITPDTSTRTISFSVSDGTQTSTTYSRDVTVADVDQTPVVGSGNSGSVPFKAADNAPSTPVTIDDGITLSDLDNGTFASAIVQIGAGFHAGEDLLAFVNDGATMGNITASYDAVHGTLTLTSANSIATLAQWQAALRSVTYVDTAVTPDTATRSIGFSVSDGTQTSTTYSRDVTVADTDQTPILTTGSTGSVAFTAGDNVASTPVAIDTGIVVSDLDNGTLASAIFQIGAGFHAGEDVLGFVNDGATMGNITASYDAAAGTLTLSSSGNSATLAQWQAALRAVTYTDTAITPDTATRTISFSINDGTQSSLSLARNVTVADVDQTPTVGSTSSGPAAFQAGDNTVSTPIVVDNGIVLGDLDNSTLASAKVQIGTGFQPGEDMLSFVNDGATMGNITASYDAVHGTLTLTSAGAIATLAQWQAALRAVTYTDTAITPDTATRSIGFSLNDGTQTSTTYSRDVTVTDVDQTPLISSSSTGSVPFKAGDNVASTPVVVDNGITLTDRDNPTLASATVQIGAGFHAGEDLLGFVNDGATMGNITASYDAVHGTLTLSSAGATATLAQWQAALRSVTYTDTAVTPATATRTLIVSVNDGVKTSGAITRNITVADTDQTPLISSSNSDPAAFVAGDNTASTPIVVDNGITLTDRDNSTFASATVQIGTGFHAGEDLLGFVNDGLTMGNITASYDAVHGTLTLSSAGATASLAQWQAALRSVTYTDTAITPDSTTRVISFAVSDGVKASTAITREVTVTDTDQRPIISSSNTGSVSFTAGDNVASTPVVVDNGIVLSDLDNSTFASATVKIGAGFHAGEDVLGFVNDGATMGNITASYDAATGTLTLNSAGAIASLAQWQAALRSVTYTDTAITPDAATRSISFSVNDGVKTSTDITRSVTVTDVDQTPLISSSNTGPAAFVSGDNVASTPIAIDNGITLSDRDNTTFASATVQIGAGFHANEDLLAFVNDGATMGNITASYDAVHGTLTLTSAGATATLAQWQAALRSVTYTDTAVLPNTAARTLIVSVNDGTETSAALTRSVSVTATHQTPQLGGGDAQLSYTADGKSGSTITVGDGITLGDRNNTPPTTATVAFGGSFDAKHDVLGFTPSAASGDITASYNAATGTLTFSSASGTATTAQWQAALDAVTYTDTQAEHANGSRTLVFTVGDGTRTSAPLTRTLQIVGVPQPVGVPILPPTVEPDHRPTPPIAPPPQVEIPRSTMLIAPDAHERNDGVSNPLIVLTALDAPRQISTIVPRDTFTFATHDAHGNALGDTSVTSLDSIVPQEAAAAPAAAHLLPAADVHAMHQPGSAFALNVTPLLRAPANAEAAHEQASVTVTLADGAALPAWLHYDATHGTLSGTPPAGVHEIRVTLVSRDAAGNVVRREVVVRFDAHGKPAANAHAAPKPAAKPAPHAAVPPAKASLTAQFANAVATLHVPRHDAALAERQSAVAAVTPERRS